MCRSQPAFPIGLVTHAERMRRARCVVQPFPIAGSGPPIVQATRREWRLRLGCHTPLMLRRPRRSRSCRGVVYWHFSTLSRRAFAADDGGSGSWNSFARSTPRSFEPKSQTFLSVSMPTSQFNRQPTLRGPQTKAQADNPACRATVMPVMARFRDKRGLKSVGWIDHRINNDS